MVDNFWYATKDQQKGWAIYQWMVKYFDTEVEYPTWVAVGITVLLSKATELQQKGYNFAAIFNITRKGSSQLLVKTVEN